MPERQHHAKIANEMADRLQRSADVPRWNKSERQFNIADRRIVR
jgi:hypothetical protein